ncbi:hypothetical protein FA13DRAFT_1440869 [Coprinellus micaceus]|uniref:GST N-terminal domain-containing protein n=1 Tax=Coprinellus micaceus TaxID=71717 RepID=A0A4Y7TLN5_COPMI|nr:hypothetical protein FA13DRAFT_1440869 [Coprinellus micaceus]
MASEQPPQLLLHYLEHSRSQRILWLLEELEVPYTIKIYRRDSQGTPPPELSLVHPTGKLPVLEDGSLILAESGAIVGTLAAANIMPSPISRL